MSGKTILPPTLIELFKDLFIQLLMVTGGIAALAILIAALTCFVDSTDARRKIVKVCEIISYSVASSFLVYTVVTIVSKYLNPISYFDKLFDKATYSPINTLIFMIKDLF